MTNRAFLLGCNSAGLLHCDKDASLVRDALSRHAYEITLVEDATIKAPYYALLGELHKFVASCSQQDTMVFYFAGHSLSEGKGKFKLVLADEINDSGNQLLVDMLLPALRQSRAADKLLIFDCCEAGKIATEFNWQEEAGEYFRIFVATSSRATALEVDDDIGGGLFTSWIYRALTVEATRLVDPDGYLRINRLGEHIQACSAGYKSPSGRSAPIPRVYGDTAKNILLTSKIDAWSNSSTGFSPPLLAEVRAIFAVSSPDSAQVRASFDACVAHSDPRILMPGFPAGDLHRVIDYFAMLYFLEGNRLALPLVSFVARIAAAMGEPPALCGWLERVAAWLRANAAIPDRDLSAAFEGLSPAGEQSDPYLMVEVAYQPAGNGMELHCCYEDTRGEQRLLTSYDDIGLDAIPGTVAALLRGLAEPCPKLELILPKRLLNDDALLRRWERMTVAAPPSDPDEPPPRPISVDYGISLRCRERIREKAADASCGRQRLEGYWERSRACLDTPPEVPCAGWLTAPDGSYVQLLHGGALALGLRFPPQASYLRALLNAGVPLLLWPRVDMLEDPQFATLCGYLARHPLREIPEALREVRELAWANPAAFDLPEGLSLLWDDPQRLPEQADVPLDAIPLEFPS